MLPILFFIAGFSLIIASVYNVLSVPSMHIYLNCLQAIVGFLLAWNADKILK
jgi:hypothetical protein